MGRPQQMSAHPEEILHRAMDGREALQLGGGLETAHLTFALPGRLMRHLGAVVRVLIRTVDHRRHHCAVRRLQTLFLLSLILKHVKHIKKERQAHRCKGSNEPQAKIRVEIRSGRQCMNVKVHHNNPRSMH